MPYLSSWQAFALGSAFFASLTAILGKLGVEGLNSNLATLICTVVIFVVTVAIMSVQSEWAWPRDTSFRSVELPLVPLIVLVVIVIVVLGLFLWFCKLGTFRSSSLLSIGLCVFNKPSSQLLPFCKRHRSVLITLRQTPR